MVNNPYYPSWFAPQAIMRDQPGQLKGRPVTSIEEVKGTPVDFDGSVFYFPDLGNKRVFTKQINPDGTSTINLYELRPIPQADTSLNPSQYITRTEFETAIQQLQQQASNRSSITELAATEVQSAQQQAQTPVQPPSPHEYKF